MPTLIKPTRKPKGKDTQTSSTYHIRYYCPHLRRSREISTRCRKIRNAQIRLREFENLLELGQVGRNFSFCQSFGGQHSKSRDLETWLQVFATDLRAGRIRRHGNRKPVSKEYATQTLTRIRKVIDHCGVKDVDEILLRRIICTLDKLGDAKEIRSAQTRKHYERAIKSFSRWLALTDGPLDRDPLSDMEVTAVDTTDIVHPRSAFNLEHIRMIVQAAWKGRIFRGLTGPQRAILYLTAAYTGLRAKECAAIRKSDCGDLKMICVAGEFTKSGKPAVQPVPSWLRPLLSEFVAELNSDEFLWPGGWEKDEDDRWVTCGWVKSKDAGEMLRHDAKKVGIIIGREGRDANAGIVLDFHSFRHFYVTQCCSAGINDGLRKKLARTNSSAILDRYTHRDVAELIEAAERIAKVSLDGLLGKVEQNG